MNYTDIKKGMVIKWEGDLYIVTWCQNHKPGKGGAIMRTKLKHLTRGNVLERAFRGGDTIEEAMVEKKAAQLSYIDGEIYVFMDNETYEQYHVPKDVIGDDIIWIKEQMDFTLHIYQGEVIVVEPPMFVELEITETDPGVRGDTVSGGSKPATLETGAVVSVPLFVDQGEVIKVDTRDGSYIGRVK